MKTEPKLFLFTVYAILIAFAAVHWYDSFLGEEYPDRVEKLLAYTWFRPYNRYVIGTYKGNGVMEYCDDQEAIRKSRNTFRIFNPGYTYGSTMSTFYELYKNGICINRVPVSTDNIDFGSLKFERANELQFSLLINAKIVEEGRNYTVIKKRDSGGNWPYQLYLYGDDITSPDAIMHRLDTAESRDQLPTIGHTGEGWIEWVKQREPNQRGQTSHQFFNTETLELSTSFNNIRAISGGNQMAYCDSGTWFNSDGTKIHYGIIKIGSIFSNYAKAERHTKILDKTFGTSDDFLLEAEFIDENTLYTRYTTIDGDIAEKTFTLSDYGHIPQVSHTNSPSPSPQDIS